MRILDCLLTLYCQYSANHFNYKGSPITLQTGAAATILASASMAGSNQPPAYPPPVLPNGNSAQPAGKDGKKETYMSVKEINTLENGDLERERPLKHHWANASFYIMGSLSIVLPLVFLGKLYLLLI
jgi:hypothetical protein